MKKSCPMTVLCIEDDASLGRILQKRLKRSGHTVILAVTGEAGLAVCDESHVDVVVLDHGLPGMSGLDVLRTLAGRDDAPPVVMVTGEGNETVAVEAMKLGAADYIVKDVQGTYLELLAGTLDRARRHTCLEAANVQAVHDLRESEERFCTLVDASSDWVWELDREGRYTYASRKVMDLLGYEPEEILGRTLFDLVPAEDAERLREVFEDSVEAQQPFIALENVNLHKDGRRVVIETNAVPIIDGHGTLVGYRGFDRDITKRKRAEEELVRFRTVSIRAAHGHAIVDLDGTIIYVNDSFAHLHGCTTEELTGRNLSVFHNDRQMEDVHRLNEVLLKDGEYNSVEVWHVHKDGTEFPMLMSGTLIADEKGVPLYMAATAIDITEREQASAEHLRAIADYTYDWESWLAPDGGLKWANPAVERMTGYSITDCQLMADYPLQIVHEEHREEFGGLLRRALDEKSSIDDFRFRISRKDGAYCWVTISWQAIYDERNMYLGLRTSVRDITDRKRVEEALQLTQFSVDHFSDAVYWMGPDARFCYVNDAACRALGYTREELLTMTVHDIGPDFPAEIWPAHWADLKERGSFLIETTHQAKDGRLFPVEIAVNFLAFGGKEYNCAFARDITERTRIEEALRESESSLKALVDGVQTAIVVHDETGKLVLSNQMARELLNPLTMDMDGRDLSDPVWRFLNEDGTEMPIEEYPVSRLLETKEAIDGLLLGLRDPNGSDMIWLLVNGIPVIDGSGHLSRVIVSFVDITDRKRGEEVLKETMRLTQVLLDSMPCIALLLRPGSREIVALNQAARDAGAALGKTCFGTWPKFDHPCPWCLAPELWASGEERHLEMEGIGVTWDVHWIPVSKDLYMHYAFDITERKMAEQQTEDSLREKEVLLREIHHRVKNNMQVIVSLLRMHSRRSHNDEVRDIFDECRDRVNAMSLVHETLYRSDDLARIDFEAYLKKLCRNLGQAYGAPNRGIAVKVEPCNVLLGMDQGIAVGMVVCELVGNAFKHAFLGGEPGLVSVGMSSLDDEEIELIVEDDGKGLPPEIDIHDSPSLGLQLAVAAATRELDGSIEVKRDGGTRFIIRFKGRIA